MRSLDNEFTTTTGDYEYGTNTGEYEYGTTTGDNEYGTCIQAVNGTCYSADIGPVGTCCSGSFCAPVDSYDSTTADYFCQMYTGYWQQLKSNSESDILRYSL